MRHFLCSAAFLSWSIAAHAQEDASGRTLARYETADLFAIESFSPGEKATLGKDADRTGIVGRGHERRSDAVVPAVRALLSMKSEVQLKDGILAVRATEEEHRGVRDLLKVFRRRLGLVVKVDVRMFQSAADPRETPSATFLNRLSPPEADQLRKKVEESKAGAYDFPTLTLHGGQEGTWHLVQQTAYVSEHTLTIDAKGKLLVDPVVSIASAGLTLSLRPVVKDADREEVLLEDLQISLSEPRRKAFRTIETPYGKVEDPELQTTNVTLNALLKGNETLLAGPFLRPWSAPDDPKVWFVLHTRVEKPKEK